MKIPKNKQITITFELFRFIERLIFLGIIIYFVNDYLYFKNQSEELESLIEVKQDSLKSYRNEFNEMISTIKVFETEKTQSFNKLKTKDSAINHLQKIVKNYKNKLKKQGSVTILESNTEIQTTNPTEIYNDSIYKSKFNLNGWVFGTIMADSKNTTLNLKVKNKYDIIIGREKKGLFKSTPYAEIHNYNPYSETTTVRTYQVKLPKPKKFGLGFHFGMNQNLKPNVSFGLNYSPIRF